MGKKQNNEIVEYKNKMNLVAFDQVMTAKEQDIFFAIVSRMRNKGTNKVFFSYEYLMQLVNVNYKHRISRFTELLKHFFKQMQDLKIYRKSTGEYDGFVLFPTFQINSKKKKVAVRVNLDLIPYINHLKQWTRFSLREFVHLKSKYSKTCLRLCKERRVIGNFKMSLKSFNTLFGIPKGYRTAQVTKQVIHPIIVELIPIIRGFAVYRLRGAHNKTTGYLFEWTPESHNKDDFSKGPKRDRDMMLKYIRMNGFANRSEKTEAAKEVNARYHVTMRQKYHTTQSEPTNVFKRTLKDNGLPTLKLLYEMYLKKSPTIHFSTGQARKLRSRIKYLERKSKIEK